MEEHLHCTFLGEKQPLVGALTYLGLKYFIKDFAIKYFPLLLFIKALCSYINLTCLVNIYLNLITSSVKIAMPVSCTFLWVCRELRAIHPITQCCSRASLAEWWGQSIWLTRLTKSYMFHNVAYRFIKSQKMLHTYWTKLRSTKNTSILISKTTERGT